MIVQSMTPEEVYMEIERDMPNVSAWWMRQRKILVRRALKMLKFPFAEWYDHMSNRRNRYLVWCWVAGRKFGKNNLSSVCALQKMERGWAVFFTRWPWQYRADRMVYMPHAFDRYAERCNVQKTGIELIKYVVERNGHGFSTDDVRFSGRSVRYKNRENLCHCTQDGVFLGELIGDIFVAHTFITYEMATGLQRKQFERCKELIMDNQELMTKFLNT